MLKAEFSYISAMFSPTLEIAGKIIVRAERVFVRSETVFAELGIVREYAGSFFVNNPAILVDGEISRADQAALLVDEETTLVNEAASLVNE